MKIRSWIISIYLLFLAFSPMSGQIACNYEITNNTDCDYVINVDFYDNCSSTPCQQYFSQTILAQSGPVPFNCAGCGTLCNVVVTVLTIGTSTAFSPGTFVDVNNSNDHGTAPCVPTGNYHWDWSATGTFFSQ